ncbi:MAG: hypothetical protein MUC36_20725 [Planctomycetes bacterium]|jgi:hypothetical protein|nr:hypothetical protein [Planctomycetota bacterium]
MTATTLKPGTGKELKRLFALLSASISETLGSLISREITVRPSEPALQDVDAFLADLPRTCAVARGALDKGFAGKSFQAIIEVADAIAMAGLLMMTPEDVVNQRRTKGTLEGEDAEAFGELGNVLYSGLGGVLREQVGNIDIRFQDHGVIKPGVDKNGVLGSGNLVVFGFRMKVGDYPESTGALAVDLATAEAWNKSPLEFGGGEAPAGAAAPAPAAPTAVRPEDEGLESIPLAPVRGTLAAFVLQGDALRMLRRSCRRVGFELRRHGRGEIPNPAAHRNEVVVLDVPPGEERRFDWCRRLKEMSTSTKVVLLLHHPSRPRVTQAFLSKADAILGFPCDEMQLSQKLGTLLPPAPAPAPAGDPAPPAAPA